MIKYYYQPLMKGSNSIKDVFPAILEISDLLQKKYSKPYRNGSNYREKQVWYRRNENGNIIDPFSLQFSEIRNNGNVYEITDGGGAATAYSKLQFYSLSTEKRKTITEALLKYCELDTLAMVMIFEHWNFRKNKK